MIITTNLKNMLFFRELGIPNTIIILKPIINSNVAALINALINALPVCISLIVQRL